MNQHELLPGQPDTLVAGPRASGYQGKEGAAWTPDGIHIAFETESDAATAIMRRMSMDQPLALSLPTASVPRSHAATELMHDD